MKHTNRTGPVRGWLTGPLAVAGLIAVSAPATAQTTSVYALSQVCGGGLSGTCIYGPNAPWSPPSGSAVGSSVAHSWSYVAPDGDISYNYNVSASAQATVAGVDRWSASSTASGYMNAEFYNSNGVSASGQVAIYDSITPASTAGWQGPGTVRLTYHISGSSDIVWSVGGDPTQSPSTRAYSDITFACGYSLGGGSSACDSPDFAPPAPGSYLSSDHLNFDVSQSVDRTVSFDISVFSGQTTNYGFTTYVNSSMRAQAAQGHTFITGGATTDFSHTFVLADVQLFDAGHNEITDWSVVSGSGFDYAHLATSAVPEPGTGALLSLGALVLGAGVRRRRVASSVATPAAVEGAAAA